MTTCKTCVGSASEHETLLTSRIAELEAKLIASEIRADMATEARRMWKNVYEAQRDMRAAAVKRLAEAERERDAYKRAKAENDSAQRVVARAREWLGSTPAQAAQAATDLAAALCDHDILTRGLP